MTAQAAPQSEHARAADRFRQAIDDYKRQAHRPFPTWSEVLEVAISLGYRKVAEPTPMPEPPKAEPPKAVRRRPRQAA